MEVFMSMLYRSDVYERSAVKVFLPYYHRVKEPSHAESFNSTSHIYKLFDAFNVKIRY
jgi:hypothetical protein